MNEIESNWKPVFGWEDRYAANEAGQIKSLNTGLILAQSVSSQGYLFINREWIVAGKRFRKKLLVHRLIWSAFNGDCEGCTLDHIDRNKCNNHLNNLRVVTKSQNRLNQDKRKDGIASQYVGVIAGRPGRFRPRVKKDGKPHFAKTFKCDTAAAIARDRLAVQVFGSEHVSLNFPALFGRKEPSACPRFRGPLEAISCPTR